MNISHLFSDGWDIFYRKYIEIREKYSIMYGTYTAELKSPKRSSRKGA